MGMPMIVKARTIMPVIAFRARMNVPMIARGWMSMPVIVFRVSDSDGRGAAIGGTVAGSDKCAIVGRGVADPIRSDSTVNQQAGRRPDDRAHNEADARGHAASDASYVRDAAGRTIEEAQEIRREVDAVDLVAFAVVHTLIVTGGQGQRGAHQVAAVGDAAVEEQVEVGDLAPLTLRADMAHQGIDGRKNMPMIAISPVMSM